MQSIRFSVLTSAWNCLKVHKNSNVEVDTYNGLLVDYAKKVDAVAIVKGLRAVSDFDYEFQQALTNKSLLPQIETVFLAAKGANMFYHQVW